MLLEVVFFSRRNSTSRFGLFGDQFSNFNAGKMLLLLEGIGGLRYSVVDDVFIFADNLPLNWTVMEFRVPVKMTTTTAPSWVTARAERVEDKNGRVTKTVTVSSNQFKELRVEPWLEDKMVVTSTPPGAIENATSEHLSWVLTNVKSARVVVVLQEGER